MKSNTLKVLILEDTKSDAELVKMHLEDFDYKCVYKLTDKREEYIRYIEEFQPDIIISDFNLPRFDGLQALKILRKQDDLTPFIFVTGTLGEENAVEAIRSGATDFIVKKRVEHLPAAILRALREKKEKIIKGDFAKQLKVNALFVSSLLQDDDWKKALKDAFSLIGDALSVDRGCYFEVGLDESTGEKLLRQRIEWVSGDKKDRLGHPGSENLPFTLFEKLIGPFSEKHHFDIVVDQLPAGALKKMLVGQGVRSLLILPVYINDSFHGFIRFDDYTYERKWTQEAIAFLETLSFNLAIAIEKRMSAVAVIESEKRYKTVISNIPGITYRCAADKNWTMHFISDEVERMTGFPAADFIHNKVRSYSSIIHCDDREGTYKIIDQINTKEPFYLEYRVVCSDNSLRWVEEKGVGVYDDKGNLQCIDGVIVDVTERKKANEKFKAIFEQTSNAVLLADDNGNYVDFNKAAIEMFEYSEAEFRKINVAQLMQVAPTDDKFKKQWKEFISSGEQRGIFALSRSNGSKLIVDYKAKANILPGVHLSILTDVTESVHQEEQLKSSERKFKALVQDGSDVIAILDIKGNYLFISDNVISILNISSESFIGRNAFEFIHDEDKDVSIKEFATLSERKQIHMTPFRMINSKSELKIIEATATNLLDDPAVGGIVINARDVTEAVLQKEELKISNERFEIAMKATNEMIWDWNVITDKVIRSKGFESIFGFRESECTSTQKFWIKNIHKEDVEAAKAAIWAALENKNQEKWDIEYRILKPNREIAFIADRGYIIRNADGNAIRVVGSVSDVTQSRKMIHEISEQNKALREIAWTQSHIVRAPLARLKGLVKILEEVEFDLDGQKEIFRNIRSSADELDEVVRKIVNKTEQIEK